LPEVSYIVQECQIKPVDGFFYFQKLKLVSSAPPLGEYIYGNMIKVVFKLSVLIYLRLRDFQARYITAEMRNAESSMFGNDGK
jgi:hypothetical protein